MPDLFDESDNFKEEDKAFFDVKFDFSSVHAKFPGERNKPLPDNLKERVMPSRSPKVIQERLNKARLILARNPDILHHRNNLGETPLITSILNGETEIVRFLLQSGADANETAQIKAGQFDRPPLAIAIQYNGDPEIVSLLLMHGADPTYRDDAGRTLLMLSGYGYTPVDTWHPNPQADPEANFRRMLDLTPDVNQRDRDGDTALHRVCYAAFIPLLCAHGAEINVHGRKGKTPLHQYLDMNGSREVIALVETLLRFGPDVNAQDENGETPLHYIAFYNEWASAPAIVRLLLATDADPNVQNKWGKTPLHLAVESIYGDVITQLLEAGAHLNLRDQEGRTPLKMLEGDKSRYYTRDGLEEEEIEALLLQAGAHL